jgi:ubiquinone/menaquinone biosynthesis C-methylase UbiE
MSRDDYHRIARFYRRFIDPVNAGGHAVARRMVPPRAGMTVLDVGCGTGAQLDGYVAAGCTIAGVDSSPAMLAEARARLGTDIDLRLGDAADLPYVDEAFDLVLASMFLHELTADARRRALGEMARVVRPDGALLITEFSPRAVGAKGRTLRAVTWIVERAAGSGHFRGFREFVATGGLPAIAGEMGLAVESTRHLAGANIAIYVVSTR